MLYEVITVNLATQEKRKLAINAYMPEGSEMEPLHWRFDP